MRGILLAGLMAVVLVSLLACADAPPQNERWGRLDGVPSTEDQRRRGPQDRAECEYEMSKLSVLAPSRPVAVVPAGRYTGAVAVAGSNIMSGPSAGMFDQCMAAKGWVRLE